jgi:hypothetical protein
VMSFVHDSGGDQVARCHELARSRADGALDQIVRRVLAQESGHHRGIQSVNRIERGRIE